MAPSLPSQLEVWLSYIATAAQALLLVKMVVNRLSLIYRWFTAYLAASLLQFLVLYHFRPNQRAYAWIWLVTEAMIAFTAILIVLELYRLVLKDYAGLSTLGRWTLVVALSIAAVVACLTLAPDLSGPPVHRALMLLNVMRRAVFSGLAIFLLLIAAFLLWCPVPLNRNVVVYCCGFAPYFLGKAATLFMLNLLGPALTRTASTLMLFVDCGCLAIWLFMLNRGGESKMVILRKQWKPGDDARLVEQLDAVNRTLLRAARR